VKIPPQTFFNFCAGHVSLLRALVEREGEISEAEARRLIRAHASEAEELPETTWRRLRELQILVPVEAGSDFHYLADPVRRLLNYLFDEAQAATPEMIRGYIQSLEALGKQLSRAIDQDDMAMVQIALGEMQIALRRIFADLDETHRSILAEVGRFKTQRHSISVRDKFRRIVHWMERYVDPMVEIVRADGPLRATFEETERLLLKARQHGLFNDLPALERNIRQLRQVSRHALRVFQQCRRELQPLYESLRRSSFMAEGAALALERLQREGLAGWADRHAVRVTSLRWQYVPSDRALSRAVRNVALHPPEPPPVLELNAGQAAPPGYLRLLWLESLSEAARAESPIEDLLRWVMSRHPERDLADALAGFTKLVFHPDFQAEFRGGEVQHYVAPAGTLAASPVRLTRV